LNGTPISSSNQISITATSPGAYEVEVFFSDGCSEISAPYNIIATNIEDLDSEKLQFYPNPTNSKIVVKGVDQENMKNIKIYDTLGQSLHSFQTTNFTIDVSSFPKGIYFIQLKNTVEKLIVE
jgi:hypothetical protein